MGGLELMSHSLSTVSDVEVLCEGTALLTKRKQEKKTGKFCRCGLCDIEYVSHIIPWYPGDDGGFTSTLG